MSLLAPAYARVWARALAAVAQADPVAELEAWRAVLPGDGPACSLAAWLATWSLQRPLALQGRLDGYPVPGDDVLRMVEAITSDLKRPPLVRLGVLVSAHVPGLAAPARLAVRYGWGGEDGDLVVARCPALAAAGWPVAGVLASPDQWTQIHEPDPDGSLPLGETWVDGSSLPEVAALRSWMPGHLDAGSMAPHALGGWLEVVLRKQRPETAPARIVPMATVTCRLCREDHGMPLASVVAFLRAPCPTCGPGTDGVIPRPDGAVFEHESKATRPGTDYLKAAGEASPGPAPTRAATPGELAKLDARKTVPVRPRAGTRP